MHQQLFLINCWSHQENCKKYVIEYLKTDIYILIINNIYLVELTLFCLPLSLSKIVILIIN